MTRSSRRRLAIFTRLRHPRLTAEATSLALEHRQTAESSSWPLDRRTPSELEQEARDRGRAGRRIARVARRLGRIGAAGQRRAHRAHELVDRVLLADVDVARVADRAVPLGRLRVLCAESEGPIDASDQGTRSADLLRALGAGLYAVALLVVVGHLLDVDRADPGPAPLGAAVVLALFTGAVQVGLALHLGRRLCAWRHAEAWDVDGDPGGFPPRTVVVSLLTGLLLLVSGLAGSAFFLAVQESGVLAPVLGLVVAASALAAPWCLVADEAYAPPPDRRFLRAAGRVLAAADRRRSRRLRRARRLLDAAARRRNRAAQLVATTRHAAGRDHLRGQRVVLLARGLAGDAVPRSAADLCSSSDATSLLPPADHACLDLPVVQLDEVLRAAERAYGAAVGAVSSDDLDLAG